MIRALALLMLAIPTVAGAALRFEAPTHLRVDRHYYVLDLADPVAGTPITYQAQGSNGVFITAATAMRNCRRESTGAAASSAFPALRIFDGVATPVRLGIIPAEGARLTRSAGSPVTVLHIRSRDGDVVCDGAVAPPPQPHGATRIFSSGLEARDFLP